MLSNTLTVEDEESVQDELKALQREAVRFFLLLVLSTFMLTMGSTQLGEQEPERPIELPSVPQTEPVTAISQGMHPILAGLYCSC